MRRRDGGTVNVSVCYFNVTSSMGLTPTPGTAEHCTSFQGVAVEDEALTAGVPGALGLAVAVRVGQAGPGGGDGLGEEDPRQSLPHPHPLKALLEAGGELLAWSPEEDREEAKTGARSLLATGSITRWRLRPELGHC